MHLGLTQKQQNKKGYTTHVSGAIPISRGDEPLMLTVEICFVNAHLGHLELK